MSAGAISGAHRMLRAPDALLGQRGADRRSSLSGVTEDALGVLTALLIAIVVIVGLYEVARRFGVPYPSLFVIGGAALGFVPGLPQIVHRARIVLLVFLPPLLFGAAFETPLRDLRANLGPIARLAFGLVIVTASRSPGSWKR